LAQELGRSVSWVKKWRKRLAEGDLQDPSVLCSYSRAHHAPSCAGYLGHPFRKSAVVDEGELPLSMVDNSAFSPNCLTILLNPVYAS
jgi:hypothetical protein